jgi:nicotinate-nucleotide adenylyltransferase
MHPDDEHWLIVGSDVARHLDTWHRHDAVRSLARLVVYERPGSVGERPPAGWPFELVDLPLIDVSSTDIRDRVRRGEPIDGLVPPAVADIVRGRALYREVAA